MTKSIFIAFLCLSPFLANSQDKLISLRVNKKPLPRVLNEIQQKSGYTIFYSNDVVNDSIKVSINAATRPVQEILHSLLDPHELVYVFRDSDLILIGKRRMEIPGSTREPGPAVVTGKILSEDGVALPFATVALLRKDTVLKELVCSEQGNFALELPVLYSSSYALNVSAVGYKSSVINFTYPDTATVKRIKLTRQPGALKEVTINAIKSSLERKVDRLIFRLGNTAFQGTDLTEALKFTPMVKVSENGIAIVGKGSVAVMVNERMLYLEGTSLMSYLKSLRSDDIERIEVITTPPARYEAQGNGGLINIVLKKNLQLGWSGNASLTYMQKTYPLVSLNSTLNYQSRKLSSSLKLREFNSEGIIKEQGDILGTHSILSKHVRKTLYNNAGFNLGMNYKLSKKTEVGFIYDYGHSNSRADQDTRGIYSTQGMTDSVLTTTARNRNPVTVQILNLYYDHKFDSTGTKLSMGVNMFSNTPGTNNEFMTVSDQAAEEKKIKTHSLVKFRIWSAQTDLVLPGKRATVESGIKFNSFSNDADVRYFEYLNQQYVLDRLKSNIFNYQERNLATYVSVQEQVSKKWTAKAGLRYEYMSTESYSPTTFEKTNTGYGKLFPTAYVLYKRNEKNTFSLNYSRRIERPYLRLINPFRFYVNPYAYFTGNPLLRPSLTHNAELSYLFKGILSVVLYGTRLNNGYGDLTFVKNGYIISKPDNYLTKYSGGILATLSIKPKPWWDHSFFANYTISKATSSIPDVLSQHGSGFNYSTNNTFKINKVLTASLNFSHSLPSTQGNQRMYNQFSLSTGCRASMFKNKLQVGASYIKGSLVKYRIYYRDFEQYLNTDYDYRTLVLNCAYSFGRKKVSGATKNINFGEKQRGN